MSEMIKQFGVIMSQADRYYDTPPRIPLYEKQIPITLGKYFYRALELSLSGTGRYDEAEIVMKCVCDFLATLDETTESSETTGSSETTKVTRVVCYPFLETRYYKQLRSIDTWRDTSQMYVFIIGLLENYLLPLYTTETIRTNIKVLIEKLDMATIFCHNRNIHHKLSYRNNIVFPGRNDYIMVKQDGRWKPVHNTLLMLAQLAPDEKFTLPYDIDPCDILDKVGDGTSVATITDLYRYCLHHYDGYVEGDNAFSELHATSLGLPTTRYIIHAFAFSPSIFVLRERYPTCRNIDVDKVLSSETLTNSYLKWAHQFCPVDMEMLPPIEEYMYRFVFPNIQEIIPKPHKSARK